MICSVNSKFPDHYVAVVARGGELARPRVDAAHGAQARAEAPRAAARAAHVVACAEIASVSHRPSRGLARPARTAESVDGVGRQTAID